MCFADKETHTLTKLFGLGTDEGPAAEAAVIAKLQGQIRAYQRWGIFWALVLGALVAAAAWGFMSLAKPQALYLANGDVRPFGLPTGNSPTLVNYIVVLLLLFALVYRVTKYGYWLSTDRRDALSVFNKNMKYLKALLLVESKASPTLHRTRKRP